MRGSAGMPERVLGLIAAMAVVASALYVAREMPALFAVRDRPLPKLTAAATASEMLAAPAPSPDMGNGGAWPALFAAAVVEVQPMTGEVTVRRRGARRPAAPLHHAVELELVALEQPPFRLQLAGYLGDGENTRVLIRHLPSGAVRAVGSDAVLAEWRAHVVRVDVSRQATGAESGGARPMVARAEVVDLETQERIHLDSREAHAPGPARGEFRCRRSGERWRAAVGDERDFAGLRVRVEALQSQPPQAHVTRLRSGAAPEHETLPLLLP